MACNNVAYFLHGMGLIMSFNDRKIATNAHRTLNLFNDKLNLDPLCLMYL